MLLRQKINLLGPGEFTGRAPLSAPREFWNRATVWTRTLSKTKQAKLARAFDQRSTSPELSALIGKLAMVRKRILANTLLQACTMWLLGLGIAIVLVAMISSKLSAALVVVAALALVSAAAILVLTWRNRPSNYETAQQLDSAAVLKDRISTAIYLGDIRSPDPDGPDGIIVEQRKDALSRLAKIEPCALFPLQLPGNSRSVLVVALIAAGLLVYRVHHQPPLVSLLQTTARSQLVQSIFSPIVHAM